MNDVDRRFSTTGLPLLFLAPFSSGLLCATYNRVCILTRLLGEYKLSVGHPTLALWAYQPSYSPCTPWATPAGPCIGCVIGPSCNLFRGGLHSLGCETNKMAAQALVPETAYQGTEGSVTWRGYGVSDEAAFRRFMHDRVGQRVRDEEVRDPFEVELRGLATTGMATEFVERLLQAIPEPPGWEIGEALAECVLQGGSLGEVCWPWNTVRDRRTPRASLPGADLVGFFRQDNVALLLFGEVKTSSDRRIPPNVMHGGGALTWQLNENATRLDVQCTLLRWLRSRCFSADHRELYRAATSRYVNSGGKEILLVGVLVRDTEPDERDVRNRAIILARKLGKPTRIEIHGWYLPVPIDQWAALLRGGAL